MDLQLFLAVNMIAISVLVIVVSLVMRTPGALAWSIVNALVAATGGLALYFDWPWPGVITAAIFVPLVLVPAACNQRVVRYRLAQDLPKAARYARLAALFHPTHDARFSADILSALAHDTREEVDTALTALLDRASPAQRCAVLAQQAVVNDDWPHALAVARDATCATTLGWLEIRALGALGHCEEMVATYARERARLVGPNLAICQLFMLAFCGRRIAVETLLARLTSLHPDNVRFWRAIAALAADDGDAAAARADLADLARTTRIPGLAEMCTRHAGADGVPVPRMSPQAIALVDDTETRVMREAAVPKRALLKSPVTLALIAVNVAAFAAEIWLGGSQSPEALVTLGALWPPLVLVSGEWWRLLTAPFLHFGPVHLVANMFVLALLGPLCETAFGRWPMLLAYLGGGVLSTAAVLGMMIENWAGYGLLVGASGAIFTLFGLLFVRRARQWLTSRDVLDRQQILLLLIVLAVQFAIDLTLPEVSLAAHASGFVVGALAGWLLWPRTRDRLDEGAGRPPQSA